MAHFWVGATASKGLAFAIVSIAFAATGAATAAPLEGAALAMC